ncbi:MAG: HAMP domain-containing protein [Clostridia bacterium]|nr:cell wall metabolism sensor histidine kinase WalK [Oscillospiraceae bacterium]MBQ7034038.1 HAMP domain-containing protein [Clostridia bacterium]
MFKKIQWKVLTVFLLLVISVMLVVGTFLLNSISRYYHDEFRMQMEQSVFTADFVSQLDTAASSDAPEAALRTLLDSFAGRMGIDSYRNFYLLDGKNAAVLYAPDGAQEVRATSNVLAAVSGRIGGSVDRQSAVMDYAYPVMQHSRTAYIVYISDSKEELYGIMESIFTIILGGLLLGLGLAVLLGLILSRTITAPIVSLKKRAEKIAAGDFESNIEVRYADEIGQLTGSFNTMASELRQTLADIAAEKNKVETILTYMADGVMAFYRDGSVMHVNPAARKMLDIGDGEESFDELFARLDTGLTMNSLLYLETDNTVEKSLTVCDTHIRAYFAKLTPEKGPASGIVAVLQDITEQQRLEDSRREFVANVSHELRTPLTNVKSYGETLLEAAEEGSMEKNFLNVICGEADRMTRLVRDLLMLSQLDYGNALRKAPFSLPDLAESVVQRLRLEAEKRSLSFTYDNRAPEMPPVNGDKDRVEQVLVNVVSNAIKYTPEHGMVHVECTARLTEAIVTVTDTGIGIPDADLPRIFERFYRVDKARSRKMGGTGLGLAIAREIVEAHGGRITIQSGKGRGTKVQVLLPIYGTPEDTKTEEE